MTEKPEALRLADEIDEDYCRCLPAYKDRGRTDPQCESCNTEDWRHEAAAELRRLHSVNAQLLEALEGLERYSDGIICYASTMGEYEPNLLVFNARAAIAAAKEMK